MTRILKLCSCQHFLVDFELERSRQKVFDFAVEPLSETIVNEKFDHFFSNLKCAAKVNRAFGFFIDKYRRRRIQILLRTRKQYPAGRIETGVYPS